MGNNTYTRKSGNPRSITMPTSNHFGPLLRTRNTVTCNSYFPNTLELLQSVPTSNDVHITLNNTKDTLSTLGFRTKETHPIRKYDGAARHSSLQFGNAIFTTDTTLIR